MKLLRKDFSTLTALLEKYKIIYYYSGVDTSTGIGRIIVDKPTVRLYFEKGEGRRDIKKLYKLCSKYKSFSLTFIVDPTVDKDVLQINFYKEQ